MDIISLTTFLLLTLSCVAVGLAIISMIATKTLNAKFQQSLELIKGLHKNMQKKDEQLALLGVKVNELENKVREQGDKMQGMDYSLGQEMNKLEQQVQDNMLQDPTTKQYQRATELLKEGLSIEQVMEACELPRAEIDILVGLQRR